jgi:hypothetical protein
VKVTLFDVPPEVVIVTGAVPEVGDPGGTVTVHAV